MTRESETLNADIEKLKENEQLYGAIDLYKDTKEYLKDCKINKNSVIARELLLTASPHFFKGMSKADLELWKYENLDWLRNAFGDNLRAVYLHMDETSPHLHSIVIAKQWCEKRRGYTLQSYKYFNGVQMLRDMQDNYAEAMTNTFPVMQRGIKGSKARHIPIQHFYNTVNQDLDTNNMDQVMAKAKNEELLKIKNNHLDKTLKSFQHFNKQKQEENEKLKLENERLIKELAELKGKGIEVTKEVKQENKKTISKGFSGRRY